MKLFYTFLIVLFSISLKAQDPHFSQFNRANMYLNPASVGNLKSWTVNYQFRNQWPNISGSYVTNNVGVQYGYNKTFKGIGVTVLNNVAGGVINITNLSVPFAFGFKIGDNVDVSLGMKASFIQESVDVSKLTFGDQIDNQLGFSNSTSEDSLSSTVSFPDLSVGVEVKFANLKLGMAGAHILEPNESFMQGGNTKLPFKFDSYINYDIVINPVLTITPSVFYSQQRDFNAFIISTTTSYKIVKLMVAYRMYDAVIFGVAYTRKRFDIGYSYDLTTSKLSNATGGSHEIGIRFRFGKNKEGDFDQAL